MCGCDLILFVLINECHTSTIQSMEMCELVGNNINCAYRIRKALENRTNMEDDRVAILEAQLSQAKLIAEEADKKYEEVRLEVAAATLEVSVGDGGSFTGRLC